MANFSKAAWIPGIERLPVKSASGSTYTDTGHRKGLIHTTEGRSIDSAMGSYRNNQFAPHITQEPGRRVQHSSFNFAASTLANRSGGAQTNRLGVVQIELCGTADKAASWDPKDEYYVGNWDDDYLVEIAQTMLDIEKLCQIPRRATVAFEPYPGSYGINAKQRLSASRWDEYSGWLGHQHCPENTHGDPGVLPIRTLFAIMHDLSTPVVIPPPPPLIKPEDLDVPKLRDPHKMATSTDKVKPQPLRVKEWTPVRMSNQGWALNPSVSITPCLFSYDASIYLDIEAGRQIQVRTWTSLAAGQHALTSEDDEETGNSWVHEFTATGGISCCSWSMASQFLRAGEYLRVEVLVWDEGVTVTKAQSTAHYWKV